CLGGRGAAGPRRPPAADRPPPPPARRGIRRSATRPRRWGRTARSAGKIPAATSCAAALVEDRRLPLVRPPGVRAIAALLGNADRRDVLRIDHAHRARR